MVEYKTLLESVIGIINDVSSYSTGEIEMILNGQGNLSQDIQKKWNELTLDICEDRKYCRLLGVVDYNNLPQDDIRKIEVAALYLAESDPNIILPYI